MSERVCVSAFRFRLLLIVHFVFKSFQRRKFIWRVSRVRATRLVATVSNHMHSWAISNEQLCAYVNMFKPSINTCARCTTTWINLTKIIIEYENRFHVQDPQIALLLITYLCIWQPIVLWRHVTTCHDAISLHTYCRQFLCNLWQTDLGIKQQNNQFFLGWPNAQWTMGKHVRALMGHQRWTIDFSSGKIAMQWPVGKSCWVLLSFWLNSSSNCPWVRHFLVNVWLALLSPYRMLPIS